MKNVLNITTTLLLGAALSLGACNKDKKPAAADPAAPAAAAPGDKPADPAAPAAAGDPAKPAGADAKPAGGGW